MSALCIQNVKIRPEVEIQYTIRSKYSIDSKVTKYLHAERKKNKEFEHESCYQIRDKRCNCI